MNLITYDEALEKLLRAVKPGPTRQSRHFGARDVKAIAEDLIAAEPHPRFDNSAVDGYAIHAADGTVGRRLQVVGVVAAGSSEAVRVTLGAAVRIFTGAPIPEGAGSVIMQEDVVREGEVITLKEELKPGAHIRRAGSEFKVGEVIAQRGSPINAGLTALLAEQDLQDFRCYDHPSVAVITTGDELVRVGEELGPGQIRDSVGPMLAILAGKHLPVMRAVVPDDPAEIKDHILEALEDSDCVVVSGGASVGDRDFLERVVGKLGEVVFHGVRMRPGKPVLFGLINGKPVLGLPGNPASAFVCFNVFGVPMMNRMAGLAAPRLAWHLVPFEGKHEAYGRDVFVRIEFHEGLARPIGEQSSFGLRSLALGQGLARLVAEKPVKIGDLVPVAVL